MGWPSRKVSLYSTGIGQEAIRSRNVWIRSEKIKAATPGDRSRNGGLLG